MTTHIELDRETTPVKEPAKAKGWKNKWLIAGSHRTVCGECRADFSVGPGDELLMPCCVSYDSERNARAHAGRAVRISARYLGPIQVPA